MLFIRALLIFGRAISGVPDVVESRNNFEGLLQLLTACLSWGTAVLLLIRSPQITAPRWKLLLVVCVNWGVGGLWFIIFLLRNSR